MKHFLLITCILLASLLTSCSPRIVERLVIQRDTTYLSSHVRDSIYLHDSVYVKEYIKGDTVFIVKYRDRWRDRTREVHDTLWRTKIDSVQVSVPVEVEKKLPVGKKIRLWLFLPLVVLSVIGWRKELVKMFRWFIRLFV